MATKVPAIAFTDAGFVAPLEADILSGVQSDINTAFGGNLSPSLTTPQGQLAQAQTAIIGDKNDKLVALFNGVDPAYASGRMQDAIGRIYYITRKPALPTVVTVTCMGLTGTVIPVGAQVEADDSNIYVCTGAGTIPASGTINLQFECQKSGPIACPAKSVNRIYKAIPGWDRVSNVADGTMGRNVESRTDFEYRRSQSVALNGKGSLPSVRGAVFDVKDVLDVYTDENTTSAPLTRNGVTLPPHSIYVAVVGGDDTDIAKAIWVKKAPGCDMLGNTTVQVQDAERYSAPYPTYPISFQRPTSTPIYFSITLANTGSQPANITQLVQSAILTAFNGADGGMRARIGTTIYAARYYAGLVGMSVVTIKIGLSAASANADSISLNGNASPTTSAANISVVLA